jgi:hypothetical protein
MMQIVWLQKVIFETAKMSNLIRLLISIIKNNPLVDHKSIISSLAESTWGSSTVDDGTF